MHYKDPCVLFTQQCKKYNLEIVHCFDVSKYYENIKIELYS